MPIVLPEPAMIVTAPPALEPMFVTCAALVPVPILVVPTAEAEPLNKLKDDACVNAPEKILTAFVPPVNAALNRLNELVPPVVIPPKNVAVFVPCEIAPPWQPKTWLPALPKPLMIVNV